MNSNNNQTYLKKNYSKFVNFTKRKHLILSWNYCLFRNEGFRGMDFRNATKREQKRFERGDLRNSLRERRAAREIILSKPVTQSYTFPKYV